jgi:hypothetical protein
LFGCGFRHDLSLFFASVWKEREKEVKLSGKWETSSITTHSS